MSLDLLAARVAYLRARARRGRRHAAGPTTFDLPSEYEALLWESACRGGSHVLRARADRRSGDASAAGFRRTSSISAAASATQPGARVGVSRGDGPGRRQLAAGGRVGAGASGDARVGFAGIDAFAGRTFDLLSRRGAASRAARGAVGVLEALRALTRRSRGALREQSVEPGTRMVMHGLRSRRGSRRAARARRLLADAGLVPVSALPLLLPERPARPAVSSRASPAPAGCAVLGPVAALINRSCETCVLPSALGSATRERRTRRASRG